jgi:hypothetical protein
LRKKTFLFFLLGLLTVLCLAVPAWANGPTVGPVAPGTVNINQEFDVNVQVNDVTNLAAVEFKLSYDPNILEALSITKGVPAKATVFKEDITTPGLVWFASSVLNPADVYTGSGTVAVVKFKAKEAGQSTLALSGTALGYWDGTGTGSITHNILPPTTVNVVEQVVVAPTVQTNAATNLATTSATLNGNITNTGGENCDQRKFQYKQQGAVNWTDAGSETGSFGTGAFNFNLTGLTPNTNYEYKALAHNSAGWGVGTPVSFTTGTVPEELVITVNLSPEQDISFTRPLTITGTATGPGAENVAWLVEIKDGDVVVASHTPANSAGFTWEYKPVEGLPVVGNYSVRVVATPGAGALELGLAEQAVQAAVAALLGTGAPVEVIKPFNIYNYPLKVTALDVSGSGETRTLTATIKNLEASAQNVQGICQITGPGGNVVFLELANEITINANGSQEIEFTTNALSSGTYKAELFIWLFNEQTGWRTMGTPGEATFTI